MSKSGDPPAYHRSGQDPECCALAIQLAAHQITFPGSSDSPSEAMVFGIGGAIGMGVFQFVYEAEDFASFFVTGRHRWDDARAWFTSAVERLGLTCELFESGARKASAEALASQLAEGYPVVAWADSGSLSHRGLPPYYAGGGYHTVSVHSQSAGLTLISDLAKDPIAVPDDEFADARQRIRKHRHRLLRVRPGRISKSPEQLIYDGLLACVQGLQKPRSASFALGALEVWSKRITAARGRQAWANAFPAGHRLLTALVSMVRFVQCHENDGALHRRLMADFLRQADELVSHRGLADLAVQYDCLAEAWQELACAALPISTPGLWQLGGDLRAAHGAYLASRTDARAQLLAANTRIDECCEQLKKGGQFPLTEPDVAQLLTNLSERVGRIFAAEGRAFESLVAVTGAME